MNKKANNKYILDMDGSPVPQPSLAAWGRWMENRENCRIALTTVRDFTVSTVFLGIDHNFGDEGDPVLFETMIYYTDPHAEPKSRENMTFLPGAMRYPNVEQAEWGHEATVARLRELLDEDSNNEQLLLEEGLYLPDGDTP